MYYHPYPKPPKEAIFSGYFMDYEHLQKLVHGLDPSLAADIASFEVPRSYIMFVMDYKHWRKALPKEEKLKAPVLRVIHGVELWEKEKKIDPNRAKFFFSMRFVAAVNGSVLEDYPESLCEGEFDEVRLEEFSDLVKRRNNVSLDRDCLQFGCFKDDHPYYDTYLMGW